MFALRYFPASYFAPRYWAESGAAAVVPVVVVLPTPSIFRASASGGTPDIFRQRNWDQIEGNWDEIPGNFDEAGGQSPAGSKIFRTSTGGTSSIFRST